MLPKPVEDRRTAAIFRAGNRQAVFPALSILISASFVIKAHRRCFFLAKRNADRERRAESRFRQTKIFRLGPRLFSVGLRYAGLFRSSAGDMRLFLSAALCALVRNSLALCGGAASGAEPPAGVFLPAGHGAVAGSPAALGNRKRPVAICGAFIPLAAFAALPSPPRH